MNSDISQQEPKEPQRFVCKGITTTEPLLLVASRVLVVRPGAPFVASERSVRSPDDGSPKTDSDAGATRDDGNDRLGTALGRLSSVLSLSLSLDEAYAGGSLVPRERGCPVDHLPAGC